MINGHCFTYLDDYQNEKWPHVFVAVPRVGEYIESRSSKRVLKIVRVTYCQVEGTYEPEVKIELSK